MTSEAQQSQKERGLFASMLKHVFASEPGSDPLPQLAADLGSGLNADSCRICMFKIPGKHDIVETRCEWHLENSRVKSGNSTVDMTKMPDFREALITTCDFCFTDINKVNPITRSILEPMGIKAMVSSPLRGDGDSVNGFVALEFADTPESGKFSPSLLMNLHEAAEVIAAGHHRHLRDLETDSRIHELEKRINEAKEIAKTTSEERDEAIKAERAKTFFFSTVSHDIRTPLNAILGFAELLKLGIADEGERNKAIESIMVSGNTLLELINDVLDLSKLESGKMEIVPVPTDCAKLIRETVAVFEVTASKKNVQLITEIGAMPFLELDPQRIKQLLYNLVGNAMKFTDRGHVKVTAEYSAETFSFTVEDTGCGISEEDQQRIASPFVQLGYSGKRGGTGLGLAICKQLVFRMDGSMELSSEIGIGTTFKIVIPGVKTAGAVNGKQLTSTQIIRMMPSSVQTMRVLLVDDMPINLAVVKALLARLGVRDIVTAANGREALLKLGVGSNGLPGVSAASFDLVLTDMWMPELDGAGLLRAIRRLPHLANLPVYAITADVDAQKNEAELGFNGILFKPVTLEKLRDVLS